MRLSRPPFARSLAITAFAAAVGSTTLPAVAGNGDLHRANPVAAEQARQQAMDHTQALVALQKRWVKARGNEKSRALQQMIAKSEARRAFLLELMETRPAEVLRIAIPDEKQVGMPAEVVEKLEQRLELSGQLEVFYEDREDGTHALRHFLNTDFGERFELHVGRHAAAFEHGRNVQLKGLLFGATDDEATSDGDFVLDDEASETLELALDGGSTGGSNGGVALASSATFGAQSTLVINVNFQDSPTQPWSPTDARNTVFGTASDFIRENSFGQTWLTGDVTGWLTLPLNSSSCDSAAIVSAARDQAQARGFNLSAYDRFIYAFPYTTACPFSGVGSVGGTTSSMLINGSMKWYTVAHEMGHNLGLFHSHALECGSAVTGSNCSTDEYGDGVDIMGRVMGHYSAFQKERLGWLDSSSIRTLSGSGVHELESYASAQGNRPKALKIPKGTDPATGQPAWYYIELRQPEGFDSVFSGNTNVTNGVVLHTGIQNQGNSSYLLDMTPGSYASNYADSKDPALETGYSFSDAEAGLTVTTDWVDAGVGRVNVQLDGDTTSSCVRANPSLSFSPAQGPWVAAGTAVTYSLTVKSNDSGACGSASFSLAAGKPSGWSAVLGASSLTLAPGESRFTSLTVTSAGTATDGFYNINVTATSGSHGTSASATYVVDNPIATNSAPLAYNDSASTAHNTPVTINVLGNDRDPDGDALTVTALNGVNGTAVINANGSVTFTPANGFSGTETFSYTVSDGKGGSASANVSVNVAAAPVASNKAPVARNDSAATGSNSAVTIAVLGNDYDPDGDALKVISVAEGGKGSVRINADGTLTFTPAKNFKNSDSFSYTISDGKLSDTATVTVLLSESGSTTGGNGKGNGRNR